ncbi:MAG TPA: Hsp20/alpha crystallin family protein [Gemmatimonadales bacterium]|jgi:HSP20 family protein|nr:Hsp20/alpha crystallin family protein [Gemmatimonadales bacterium]
MKVAKLAPVTGKFGEEVERIFDRFLTPGFLPEPFIPPFPYEAAGAEWYPMLDVTETAEEFIVRVEAPGVHKENMDINLTGTLLIITGRRELVTEASGETYLRREREVGKFIRTLRLPAPVMEKEVKAAYEDGLLVIHLRKVAPAVANRILIK